MEITFVTKSVVFLVLALATPAVHSDGHDDDHCPCAPDVRDGGHYPKHPLSWRAFEDLFVDGQSLEYLELYNLKPVDQTPDLNKLILRWLKLEDGRYVNPVSGYYTKFGICFNDTVKFDRTYPEMSNVLRYHPGNRVQFNFTLLLPTEVNRTEMVGTLFSSCPTKYLINWYCQRNETAPNGYCNKGLQMSLTSTSGPDRIPWHLVAQDLCRNKSPQLDDKRWHYTYTGPQCVLAPAQQTRRKRSVDSLDLTQISLWP